MNTLKNIWDTIILFITVYAVVEAPLLIVFDINPKGIFAITDFFISIFYIIDIFFIIITIKKEKNLPHYQQKSEGSGYIKMWLWSDIISAIPFDILFSLFFSGQYRIFRAMRLLKLIRVTSIIGRIRKSNVINPSILRLLALIFWIVMFSHFIACGWIAIYDYAKDLTRIDIYIRAYYWTVTTITTIGYGDITPSNNLQILYAMMIEIIGAGMYGFIIANIANLIANIDIAKAQFQEKMEKIGTFMKYRNIPEDMQNRINSYYKYLWASRRGYDESSVLDDLPHPLKVQVSLFLNQDIIHKVPIFKGASEDFIKEIILNLEPVVFTPEDYIFTKGEYGDDMYFISSGSVDVVSDDGKTIFATLTTGQFFGEIALLLSQPRTASIRAAEYCDLYRLEKETFDRVLEKFPDFKVTIQKMAEERKAQLE